MRLAMQQPGASGNGLVSFTRVGSPCFVDGTRRAMVLKRLLGDACSFQASPEPRAARAQNLCGAGAELASAS